MFEEVKNQVKAYLPETLSPVATAIIIGGVALITGFLIFTAETYFPGFTSILPESLFNIIILSAVTLLTGFVIWLFRIKKTEKKPVILAIEDKPDTNYNYYLKENNVSYSILNKHTAQYEDERIFIAQGDIRYPANIVYVPLMKGVKIRLVEQRGYKSHRDSMHNLKKWRNSIVLETDFKGPIQKGSEHRAWAKIEVKGEQALNHLYSGSRYPIKGKINLKVDVYKSALPVNKIKLLSFVSPHAIKPITPSIESPTKDFDVNKTVQWTIDQPQTNYLYMLIWKEPCKCSWCESINFN